MAKEDLGLQLWQGRLKDLEEDYAGVSTRLRNELDIPTQNSLKRQLEEIEKQTKECASQIEKRKQELQSEKLTQLFELLKQHLDCFEEIQQAYQATVKARGTKLQFTVETLEGLKIALLRILPGTTTFNAIEEFTARLFLITIHDTLIQKLQAWGERFVNQWDTLLEQIGATQAAQESQNALLIEVSYSDETDTQTQDEAVYRIQMFLIEDVERYRTERRGYKAIYSTGSEASVEDLDQTYTWAELPNVIRQMLERENIDGTLPENAEVHIFLPQELLNCNIDCWKVIRRIGDDIPFGHHYPIFVRLYERVSRSYKFVKTWRDKWKQKNDWLKENALQVFEGWDDRDPKELYYKEPILGLKIVTAPNLSEKVTIFHGIHDLGIPLAIWGRTNLTTSNETLLDQVLQSCVLEELPSAVKQHRRSSYGQPDCHLGNHLSLLWDDPTLPPPRSA